MVVRNTIFDQPNCLGYSCHRKLNKTTNELDTGIYYEIHNDTNFYRRLLQDLRHNKKNRTLALTAILYTKRYLQGIKIQCQVMTTSCRGRYSQQSDKENIHVS